MQLLGKDIAIAAGGATLLALLVLVLVLRYATEDSSDHEDPSQLGERSDHKNDFGSQTSTVETRKDSKGNITIIQKTENPKKIHENAVQSETRSQLTDLTPCDFAKDALETALMKSSDVETIEKCLQHIKEACQDSSFACVLELFKFKKSTALSYKHSTERDLQNLLIMQRNLQTLDKAYKVEKPLEEEFCEAFGSKFTLPYSLIEADPSVAGAKGKAKEAAEAFPLARMFCKNLPTMKHHPSYDYSTLVFFLIDRIKKVSEPSQVMHNVRILRLLRPTSKWAFPGCVELSDLQTKVAATKASEAKGNIPPIKYYESILSINDLNTDYNTEQLSLMQKEAEKVCSDTTLTKQQLYAAKVNRSSIALVNYLNTTLPSDQKALAWIDTSCKIFDFEGDECREFLKKQYDADKDVLEAALKEAIEMHINNAYFLKESNNEGGGQGVIVYSDFENHLLHHVIGKSLLENIRTENLTADNFFSFQSILSRNLGSSSCGAHSYSKKYHPFFRTFVKELREVSVRMIKNPERHPFYKRRVQSIHFDDNGYLSYGAHQYWKWPSSRE